MQHALLLLAAVPETSVVPTVGGQMRFFQDIPLRKLRGLRIGTVGFTVVAFGFLCAWFDMPRLGWGVALLGMAIVFGGMVMHFANMFSRQKGDSDST